MTRIEILAVGRLKPAGLRDLCAEYYQRCSRMLSVSERELRDNAALFAAIPPRSLVVALEPAGRQLSSEQLATSLQRWIGTPGATRLVFLIGGADGLDARLCERAEVLLSLSQLTLGHRVARVVLAEQLYRAVSILTGAPYHRA